MKPNVQLETVWLRRDQLVRIDAIVGRAVIGVRGSVWLTQEGDERDILLVAGSEFELDRPGSVLAVALGGDAALALDPELRLESVAPSVPAARKRGRLAAAIDAIVPRYDPQRLAQMPVARRNALVRHEAGRLRAEVLRVVLQHATLRAAGVLRCVAMRLSAWALAPRAAHRAK